jgi:RNA polymerase sigma factor (sigma-70 family)
VERLVIDHLSYARALAHRYIQKRHAYKHADDIVQCAYVGLIQAAMSFDGREGVAFKTFAHYRIMGNMRDEMDSIMPLTVSPLACVPIDWVLDDESVHIPDRGIDDVIEHSQTLQKLMCAARGLKDKERRLIVLKFWEGKRQQEVSEMTGSDKHVISRRYSRIYKKLRTALGAI